MRKRSLFVIVLGLAGFLPQFSLAQSGSAALSPQASGTPAVVLAASSVKPADSLAALGGPETPETSESPETYDPQPAAAPQPSAFPGQPSMGLGVKFSSLGIGGEFALRVLNRANLRAGFNAFGFGENLSSNGIDFSGRLQLRSVETHFDYFLFRTFHVSPGVLLYNGNRVKATAAVAAGQTFTLGSQTYESGSAGSANGPIMGTATVNFNRVAPEILIGTGNLVPRGHRRWSINDEVGVDYEGAPKIAFGLSGSACLPPASSGSSCVNAATDPNVASNVAAQKAKFNQSTRKSYFSFWPVLSLGFSYSF